MNSLLAIKKIFDILNDLNMITDNKSSSGLSWGRFRIENFFCDGCDWNLDLHLDFWEQKLDKS